jgi:hypothetical protein
MNKKIEELNRELEKLQTKIREVQDKIDEIKREETWPNSGDDYWLIDSNGNVLCSAWSNASTVCARHMTTGNVFKTKAEAVFEINKRMIITMLKKFAMSELDWRANRYDGEMYYIYLSGKNEIKINRARGFVHSTLYFESPEKAKEAVAAVGEFRVKKYYFGVDEE